MIYETTGKVIITLFLMIFAIIVFCGLYMVWILFDDFISTRAEWIKETIGVVLILAIFTYIFSIIYRLL